MNNSSFHNDFEHKIFDFNNYPFELLALDIFRFQYQNNPLYHQYVNSLIGGWEKVLNITQIPFLPISFFKSHTVRTTEFEPEIVFESSGTTNTRNSRHEVKQLQLYRESCIRAFTMNYGMPEDWCIIGLLPSYLERQNSSLVWMVNELVQLSQHPKSGFYLYDNEKLYRALSDLEASSQKTLLIGVSFALLDFAEQYEMRLRHTTVMETGGMKGRRAEITRPELHAIIAGRLGVEKIHSEYGMTELLSQAYSHGEGIFTSPPWMRILVREEDDPLTVQQAPGHNLLPPVAGAINIIDLANLYSCAFIATDDIGKLYGDGRFEVLGRLDNSDIRGCSLLAI